MKHVVTQEGRRDKRESWGIQFLGRQEARVAEQEVLRGGPLGLLHGVPGGYNALDGGLRIIWSPSCDGLQSPDATG